MLYERAEFPSIWVVPQKSFRPLSLSWGKGLFVYKKYKG